MTEWKTFFESRTVWANLIGLLTLILSGFGLGLADGEQEKLVDAILQIVAGLAFLASTVFRVIATRKIVT